MRRYFFNKSKPKNLLYRVSEKSPYTQKTRTSHSGLSSCGLALLTVAHQALTIVFVSTSLGNVQWKRQPLHMFPSAFSPTPRPVFNTSKSERSFFPIQQCRSSWWSLIKPFPERSNHLGHGLSRVLSLVHPHTCHQALLDRVTACVSH